MSEVNSSPCPNCGANLPADLMAGIKIFNCPYCGQAIHPTNCGCSEHDPDLADELKDLEMGLGALAQLKKIKREDLAERVRLGLPTDATPQPFKGSNVVIISGPSISGGPQKVCSQCGISNKIDANFCKHCGNRF